MLTTETKPGLNLAFYKISDLPELNFNNILPLSDITEQEARKLVQELPEGFKMYNGHGTTGSAVKSLKSAALSLQIPEPEFSKYFVLVKE